MSSEQEEQDRWTKWDKRLRDVALFVFGGIAFFHELFIRDVPDLTIVVAAGALMGVPLILSADAKKGKGPK